MTISGIIVILLALLRMQAAAFGSLCHLLGGMAAVEQCDATAAAALPRQRSQVSVFRGIEQHGSPVYKPTAAAHLAPLGCAARQGQVSLFAALQSGQLRRVSGLCLTMHKMTLRCLLCSLHMHPLVNPVASKLVQCACRSFAYVASLLASTLLIGLGSISKDLSWFTTGKVYAVHGWLLVGLQSSQHGRSQGCIRAHLSLVLASDSSRSCM